MFGKLLSTGLILLGSTAVAVPSSHSVRLTLNHQLDTTSRLANVHIGATSSTPELIDISYGPCGTPTEPHHHVKRRINPASTSRVVWILPSDMPSSGCLAAWDADTLVGFSEPLKVLKSRALDPVKMNGTEQFDLLGPWFDGVKYLKDRNVSETDEKAAKSKRIGIVGGGPAGLMTALLLDTAGFKNWEIIEASGRLGGRIRTEYLEGGPDEYQYQEMGPMRFPYQAIYPGSAEPVPINDHRMVFQLADELNRRNKKNPKLKINFIEFVNSHPNIPFYRGGVRNKDGSIPTTAEAAVDPRFETYLSPEATEAQQMIRGTFTSIQNMTDIAINMFKAHKKYTEEGWDRWSEFGYITQYLKKSLDVWDQLKSVPSGSGYWTSMFETAYFAFTTFKTIDKGLDRIPKAFEPLVKARTRFNRSVRKLSFSPTTKKVTLSWKRNFTDRTYQSSSYDYAIVAAPFTDVRQWRLPQLTNPLRNAIKTLNYVTACKVALQFRTRFWEHFPAPIHGGCGSTDIPGIGSFCYPSYDQNSTGPGVLLASYNFADDGLRYVSLTDEEHVQYVLEAQAEIHGDVVWRQYAGKYSRKCWLQDQHIAASWADPAIGEHELYIPHYFQTVDNTIFVGEHTSYTHAWIASALESAIRGTVQLCLELGLVDEAKDIVDTWMARWITM